MEKSPYVYLIKLIASASHAECITTIFIIQLYVAFELLLVKHCNTSLWQKPTTRELQVLGLSVTS